MSVFNCNLQDTMVTDLICSDCPLKENCEQYKIRTMSKEIFESAAECRINVIENRD